MPSTSPSPSPPLSAAERRWAQVDRLVAGLAFVAVALVMAGTAEPGRRPDAKHAMHTS